MPPKSAAEVAVAALWPFAGVDVSSGAAPQALRASAATTARAPPRAAFLGRAELDKDVDTVSPGDARGAEDLREDYASNLSEQVGLSTPALHVPKMNAAETLTPEFVDTPGRHGSLPDLVYAGHAVHSNRLRGEA
jgi:hypothetical protein